MPFGARVLLIGAGPTGLILAQLMKMGGASHITIAANAGIKMDIARKVEAADEYIDLDRSNPGPQWAKLKEDNPCTYLDYSLCLPWTDLLTGRSFRRFRCCRRSHWCRVSCQRRYQLRHPRRYSSCLRCLRGQGPSPRMVTHRHFRQ